MVVAAEAEEAASTMARIVVFIGLFYRRQGKQILSAPDLGERFQNLRMDQSVRSDNTLALKIMRRSMHIGRSSARFLDQELARRAIPGAETKFPKCFETSRRHRTKIERR